MPMNCVLTSNVSKWYVRGVFLALLLLYLLVGALLRNGEADEDSRLSRRALLSVRSTSNSTEAPDYADSQECKDVHRLGGDEAKCNFVRSVESCQNEGGLVNYVEFVFCVVPTKLVPLAMVFLFLWLLYLFVFLATTAQEFFCPSLQIMSEVMRLSQNVAGVTLLAFGNGAPDIFSSVSAIMQRDDKKANLAIGALFGAGMFVTSVVVGSVAIVKPFTLTQRPFLRDIIFYLIGVFWTFVILWQNKVTIYSAVGLIAMYVMYVVVVIAGRVIFQKWKKWRVILHCIVVSLSSSVTSSTYHLRSRRRTVDQEPECGPVCGGRARPSAIVSGKHSHRSEDGTTMPFAYIGHFLVAAPPAEEPSALVANTTGESRHYRMQATVAGVLSGVETIIPCCSNRCGMLIISEALESMPKKEKRKKKAPAGLILTLTIPVVDHEKPNDNWNKWLNVLHCVTAPLIMMLITKGSGAKRQYSIHP
eukprot:Em0408g1a